MPVCLPVFFWADAGQAVILQQISHFHRQVVSRGDVGLAQEFAEVPPCRWVRGVAVVQFIHPDGKTVDFILHHEFRRQDGFAVAKGVKSRNRGLQQQMNGRFRCKPAVQLAVHAEVFLLAVGAEKNPVRSLEQFYDFIDFTQTVMPWAYLPEECFENFVTKTDQSCLYIYYLLDRPLPELEGKRYMSLNWINADDASQYQVGKENVDVIDEVKENV